MGARWDPCVCGHWREGHDPVKDGGKCRHDGCDCRTFKRDQPVRVVAAPARPRIRGNPGVADTRLFG